MKLEVTEKEAKEILSNRYMKPYIALFAIIGICSLFGGIVIVITAPEVVPDWGKILAFLVVCATWIICLFQTGKEVQQLVSKEIKELKGEPDTE